MARERRLNDRSQQIDGPQHAFMRERAAAHHQAHPRNATQRFIDMPQLGRGGLRRADHEGASGATLCVEGGAARGRPATLAADAAEGMGVSRPEIVGCLLIRVSDVANGMHRNIQRLRRMTCAFAGLAIQLDQRAETMWLTPDDGDGQRQA